MSGKEHREKDGKEQPKKRRRRKGAGNVEPAEEPVRGPSGEDVYRV